VPHEASSEDGWDRALLNLGYTPDQQLDTASRWAAPVHRPTQLTIWTRTDKGRHTCVRGACQPSTLNEGKPMNHHSLRAAATTILLALALAGCSGAATEPAAKPSDPVTADVDAVESATATPTQAPEQPEADTSQRGNLVKAIGETAGLLDRPGGEVWAEFQVTGIELGAECTAEFAEPAENGQFLVLSISMSTGTEWPADFQGMTLDFNPNDFSVVGPDGITENNLATFATYSCLPEGEIMADTIGPGENIVGKVVLDTAAPSGVVVYRPWYAAGSLGWEWPF